MYRQYFQREGEYKFYFVILLYGIGQFKRSQGIFGFFSNKSYIKGFGVQELCQGVCILMVDILNVLEIVLQVRKIEISFVVFVDWFNFVD